MQKSYMFQITKEDAKSLFRGLLITLAGAGLAYLLKVINAIDPATFGVYAPIVTSVMALVVNVIRKWISQTNYSPQ